MSDAIVTQIFEYINPLKKLSVAFAKNAEDYIGVVSRILPTAMIGHSLGEYVAACLANVFSLEEGLKIIGKRAKLMQSKTAGAIQFISYKALVPHQH